MIMKWIQPGRGRTPRESDLCPLCQGNVFKFYKAIHNSETHRTLFGEPCPNNGRLNAEIWGENVGIKPMTEQQKAELTVLVNDGSKRKRPADSWSHRPWREQARYCTCEMELYEPLGSVRRK